MVLVVLWRVGFWVQLSIAATQCRVSPAACLPAELSLAARVLGPVGIVAGVGAAAANSDDIYKGETPSQYYARQHEKGSTHLSGEFLNTGAASIKRFFVNDVERPTVNAGPMGPGTAGALFAGFHGLFRGKSGEDILGDMGRGFLGGVQAWKDTKDHREPPLRFNPAETEAGETAKRIQETVMMVSSGGAGGPLPIKPIIDILEKIYIYIVEKTGGEISF